MLNSIGLCQRGFPNETAEVLTMLPTVVYTQSGVYHEAWYTPPAGVHTQSGLHHEAWGTPSTVVHTKSGPISI